MIFPNNFDCERAVVSQVLARQSVLICVLPTAHSCFVGSYFDITTFLSVKLILNNERKVESGSLLTVTRSAEARIGPVAKKPDPCF